MSLDGVPMRTRPPCDEAWRAETLPMEEIIVPAEELPEPECECGEPQLSVREQALRWTDITPPILPDPPNSPL